MRMSNLNYFLTDIKWFNVISISILHMLTLFILLTFPYSRKLDTFFFDLIYASFGGFGVTAAVHRLWCHRSYKAKLPLRYIFAIFFVMSGQNTIYDWVRDHRIHHKYSETIADPHNSNRGFFFSHIGWLMLKKHPEVIKRGNEVDMSDVLADPAVRFQQKYFTILKVLLTLVIPTFIPWYFWNETFYYSAMANIARYFLSLNFTFCVNSVAHLYGTRPYNRKINPRENLLVSIVALGEGWHNYHHSFPWDYKASEFGKLNVTTFWIDLFAKLGLVYDLKKPSDELVNKYIENNGVGTFALAT